MGKITNLQESKKKNKNLLENTNHLHHSNIT